MSSLASPPAKEALAEARRIVDDGGEDSANDPEHSQQLRMAPRSPTRPTKRIQLSDSEDEDEDRWAREVDNEERSKPTTALMGSRTRPMGPTDFGVSGETSVSPKATASRGSTPTSARAETPPTVARSPRTGKQQERTARSASPTVAKPSPLDSDGGDGHEIVVELWSQQALPDVLHEEELDGSPSRQLSFPTKVDTPSSTRQPSPHLPTPGQQRQPSPGVASGSPRQPSPGVSMAVPRQPSPSLPSPRMQRPPSPRVQRDLPPRPVTPRQPENGGHVSAPGQPVKRESKGGEQQAARSTWGRPGRARRGPVLSSDSDDDGMDDSGVRGVVSTPPRRLVDKVQARYAGAERQLDAAESARALQRSPPRRRDHYTMVQHRTRVVSSSDEEECDNRRLDQYIARDPATIDAFPAPKDNRARAATPEYKRDQRIGRSQSPPGRSRSPARATSPARRSSPARGASPGQQQRGDKIVVWVAHHAETEDAEASMWGDAVQQMEHTKRRMLLADPPLSYVGVQQAMDLGRFMQDEGVDKVLASPYLATLQTAQYAAWPLQRKVAIEPGLVPPKHCPHYLPPAAKRLNYVPSLDLSFLPWTSEPSGEESEADALPRVLDAAMTLSQALLPGDRALIVTHPATALALVAALTANQRRGPVTEATKVHVADVLERDQPVRPGGVYKLELSASSGQWQSDYKCYNFFLGKQTASPHPWRPRLAGLSHKEWVELWDDLVDRYACRRTMPRALRPDPEPPRAPSPVKPRWTTAAPRSRSVGRARITFDDDDDDDDDDVFIKTRSRTPRARIPAAPLKTRAWSPHRYEARTRQMRR